MSSLVVSVGKKPDESVSLSYPDEMSDGGEVEELDVGEGEEDGVTVKVTIDPEYRSQSDNRCSPSSAFSQDSIDQLYRQLEVSKDFDSRYSSKALFMRGVEKWNDSAILDYFKAFQPISVTRKGENSCVVDFPNNRLVIEALLTLTKPLKRVSRELTTYNLFDEEEEAAVVTNSEGNFTSPLSRTSKGAGDIDMKEENSKIVVKSGDYKEVDVSRLKVPEGNWRVGETPSKSDLILIQFVELSKFEPVEVDSHRNRKRKIVGDRITIAGDLRDRLSSKRQQKGLDDSWESVEDGEEDEDDIDHGHDDRDRHTYVEENSSEELERILTREKLRPTMRMRADEEEESQRKKREESGRRPNSSGRKGFDLRDRIKAHRY